MRWLIRCPEVPDAEDNPAMFNQRLSRTLAQPTLSQHNKVSENARSHAEHFIGVVLHCPNSGEDEVDGCKMLSLARMRR